LKFGSINKLNFFMGKDWWLVFDNCESFSYLCTNHYSFYLMVLF